MSLTDEERKVVEAKGTVLLLGRSGTGKTIVSHLLVSYLVLLICSSCVT